MQYHVGMGADPQGLLSYSKARGVIIQAYSPLASGKILDPPPAALSGECMHADAIIRPS